MVGAVLSTWKVAPGTAAGALFPAWSLAVPAAMEIARVPSPLMAPTVTVRVNPVVPVTVTVPVAVPVEIRVTFTAASVMGLGLAVALVLKLTSA